MNKISICFSHHPNPTQFPFPNPTTPSLSNLRLRRSSPSSLHGSISNRNRDFLLPTGSKNILTCSLLLRRSSSSTLHRFLGLFISINVLSISSITTLEPAIRRNISASLPLDFLRRSSSFRLLLRLHCFRFLRLLITFLLLPLFLNLIRSLLNFINEIPSSIRTAEERRLRLGFHRQAFEIFVFELVPRPNIRNPNDLLLATVLALLLAREGVRAERSTFGVAGGAFAYFEFGHLSFLSFTSLCLLLISLLTFRNLLSRLIDFVCCWRSDLLDFGVASEEIKRKRDRK
ncbi:hypothetical protein BKA65DRAFT_505335 [Rhexocercosporidium sp. MPI-PUGE-AT-0058]|nr:hypothetical protein BKA65DRAFT_505335 [Rhexocercosporidium sp. MPI-PUGE-AT-0058]